MGSYFVDRTLEEDASTFAERYTELILAELDRDERLILGDADLGRAIYGPAYKDMKAARPKQMFDVGLAEANLVGISCGLSITGRIPVAHSFAAFITRRVYDTMFVSGAYAKLNIKLIGSDPGIASAYNGGTHMTFEDIALMRCVPGAVIFEPSDLTALASVLPQLLELYGVCYMRMPRVTKPIKLYPKGERLEIGRAKTLAEGMDAAIIALGSEVPEAVKAAELLREQGINVRVLDIVTVKPIDREAVLKAAKETGAIVTAENHSIHGGLFSEVSEVLAQSLPCPVEPVGIKDIFGEVGSYQELLWRFKLTASDIADAVKRCIARKG